MRHNSKVVRMLNNQRLLCQHCDVILKLEEQPGEVHGHFCVIAGQSQFIGSIGRMQNESLQFSIKNPLIITIKKFECFTCLQSIMDLFYENAIANGPEHEAHMKKLAKILEVTDDFFETSTVDNSLPDYFLIDEGNLTADTLITQQKATTDEYLCPHCGKGFKWKQGLSSHLLIHIKEKQMLCDVCGYSTTHMKALKSHKLQHTGEYFKCTFPGCMHRSNRKENLKLHIETHKRERPFVCEVCGCKFSQSKNLKRHALKHSVGIDGVKKYKCQLCAFSSYRSDNLREHVQRLHTEKELQLELPETVENSFESKVNDEYTLAEICLLPDLCATSFCDVQLKGGSAIRKLITKTEEKPNSVNYNLKPNQNHLEKIIEQ